MKVALGFAGTLVLIGGIYGKLQKQVDDLERAPSGVTLDARLGHLEELARDRASWGSAIEEVKFLRHQLQRQEQSDQNLSDALVEFTRTSADSMMAIKDSISQVEMDVAVIVERTKDLEKSNK